MGSWEDQVTKYTEVREDHIGEREQRYLERKMIKRRKKGPENKDEKKEFRGK